MLIQLCYNQDCSAEITKILKNQNKYTFSDLFSQIFNRINRFWQKQKTNNNNKKKTQKKPADFFMILVKKKKKSSQTQNVGQLGP